MPRGLTNAEAFRSARAGERLHGAVRPSSDPDVTATVILPCYREAKNLRSLVPEIQKTVAEATLSAEIIIIDDDSHDGTSEIQWDSSKCPVRLITRRSERGLSSAVVAGMSEARGRVIVVMDADYSHPPSAIPDLVSAIESGDADFAIGSRYVDGGEIDNQWTAARRINSEFATTLVRPLTSAKDPLAGFFAVSRTTLANAEHLNCIGYKIGIEILVKCRCRRVYEVPILFSQRRHGQSKLGLRQRLEFLVQIGGLYWYESMRWIRCRLRGCIQPRNNKAPR